VGEAMKSLDNFIQNLTTSQVFYDIFERPYEDKENEIELRLFESVLNPCGMPRWYLNHFIYYPDNKKPEMVAISLEENLVHPVIAIQVMIMKLLDVMIALHNIQTEVIERAGQLSGVDFRVI
jgi:hypothetical protein